jgi:hypothetical protein
LQTCEVLTENQLINNIRNDIQHEECSDISDEEIEEPDEEELKVTLPDAIKSIKTIISFLDSIKCDSNTFNQNVKYLDNVENFLIDNHLENVKQSKITDFFVKTN